MLIAATIFAIGYGAFNIAPLDVVRILAASLGIDAGAVDPRQVAVLNAIRLPRVVLALVTGAGLAVAGALMQGLFRNPLADPDVDRRRRRGRARRGIRDRARRHLASGRQQGARYLDAAARGVHRLAGGHGLVYRIGAAGGLLSLPSMLLAGIALNALALAGVGFLSYLASDEQLRNLTFWNFGSLGGATWAMLGAVVPLALSATLLGALLARPLNALALGETQAAISACT